MAHDTIPREIPFRTVGPLSGAVKGGIGALVLLGLAAVLLTAGTADGRLWQALLFNWLFWSSLALGMVMFAVALHITNAGWAWSIRRFALGGVAFLPVSFVTLVLVFLGYEHYFHHWLHPYGDPIIEAKLAWLNMPGMIARDFIAIAVLYTLAGMFVYFQVRPDSYGVRNGRHARFYGWLTRDYRGVPEEIEHSRQKLNWIAPALGIAYAVLWAIIAIDLAMSLEPHWFSTMFPVAFFWTGFHGGVAATVIAVTVFRSRLGLEPFITARQYHDLGKLVFAFSVFWMYLNWSQYIVIWYGLLPHEQEWFVHRFQEPYGAVVIAVIMLVFVLPFFGLFTRPPKKVPAILATFAGLILLGHWLERFLLIAPSVWEQPGLPLGIPEIGMGLAFGGVFLACYLWFVSRVPLLPSPATMAAADKAVVEVRTITEGARR
jgi:hypothetical protein